MTPRPMNRPLSVCTRAILAGVLVCAAGGEGFAKDPSRLWFVGGTLGYHTTEDTAQSNADLPGDPRPDDTVSREAGVEDTAALGFHAGFGLTGHFSLQMDVGYFKGEVGMVDSYMSDQFPIATTINPTNLNLVVHRSASLGFVAGELTQIPVTLTGVLRFRKDSTLNPFIGAGAGIVFMGFENGEGMESMNARLQNLRITGFEDERGTNITPIPLRQFGSDGRVPLHYPVSIDVEDSFEWHLSAGLEYAINGRMSFVADLRYAFFSEPLRIDLNGQDQVNIAAFSEEVFRPDGSVKIFNDSANAPNPLIPGEPGRRFGCAPGVVDDFDDDGHNDDLCFNDSPMTTNDDMVGMFIVQGGEIDLSGFLAQLGLRWYF